MKKIYEGNVYKLTNMNIEFERQKNIYVKYFGDICIPESISTGKIDYDLYMENAKLLKISDSPYSNYILIGNNGEYKLVYSIVPFGLGSLFVNSDDLKLCGEEENVKINKLELAKTLIKKINHN